MDTFYEVAGHFYGWVGVGGGRRRYILGKYGWVNIFHG